MFKIGHGYDVHKLVVGRDLILCGEKIPFPKGLLGHSDADVATHALIDSLLGAAGLGDIWTHFPDCDEKYKNIKSLKLLQNVFLMLKEKNFEISNVDLTIIAQLPKIAPYINNMKKNIKRILKIDLDSINIKATTEEGIGITTPNFSIACFCTSLINKVNLTV